MKIENRLKFTLNALQFWKIFSFLAVFALLFSPTLEAQESKKKKESRKVRLELKNRPSIRFGDALRVDVRAKVQTDFRSFSPQVQTPEGTFDLHRGRVGLEGQFLKHFEYEIERDFRQSLANNDQRYPWKDVKLDFTYFDNFQLLVGKFKMPFGLDETTSEHETDFSLRSRTADDLSPGRSVGGMLHGRFFSRGVSYWAGFFRHDGENGRNHNGQPIAGQTFAGRVTGTPIRELAVPEFLRPLELGMGYTRSDVPEGLSSIRGNAYSDENLIAYAYVKGPRERMGVDATLITGPFSLKSELVDLREAREGQGIYLEDLPKKLSRGWYASVTWVVTGEKKEGGVTPRKDFLKGGPGAIELAARFEQIRFGTAKHIGDEFRSPRSPNFRAQSDRSWTIGVNWYTNRYVKIQADAVNEQIEDLTRSPIPGTKGFWLGILRLQFVM